MADEPASLYLVRHGETDGNKARFIGRRDLALNTRGECQAQVVARCLTGRKIDRIFASPLSRTMSTAAPLSKVTGLAVEVRHELLEIDFGELEGQAKGVAPFKLRKLHLRDPMPGGECLDDVRRRILPFHEELGELAAGGYSCVVVGHYWSNRMLLGLLRGLPLEAAAAQRDYKPANGSVSCISADRRTGAVIGIEEICPEPQNIEFEKNSS